MIVEIPAAEDFTRATADMLNSAWEVAITHPLLVGCGGERGGERHSSPITTALYASVAMTTSRFIYDLIELSTFGPAFLDTRKLTDGRGYRLDETRS